MLTNEPYCKVLPFQLKFGSKMDKPKCWVKNALKKITFEITFLTQHLVCP